MVPSIWGILFSRIIFRIAGVAVIISKAGIMPEPSAAGISCWETTACRAVDSCTAICRCWLGGNTSMIRSMVLAAPGVCSVENTRCPVSAAVIAIEIVSKSRISPSRITSGLCRRDARRATT